MILEWLLKGIVVVVLFLLNLLGWKRAGIWLDQILGERLDKMIGKGVDKDDRPVV